MMSQTRSFFCEARRVMPRFVMSRAFLSAACSVLRSLLMPCHFVSDFQTLPFFLILAVGAEALSMTPSGDALFAS